MKSPRHTAVSRRAVSRASSSCARIRHRGQTKCLSLPKTSSGTDPPGCELIDGSSARWAPIQLMHIDGATGRADHRPCEPGKWMGVVAMWARDAFGLVVRTGGLVCLFLALSGAMGLIRRLLDIDPASEYPMPTIIVSTVFYAAVAVIALTRADFFVRLTYGSGTQSQKADE